MGVASVLSGGSFEEGAAEYSLGYNLSGAPARAASERAAEQSAEIQREALQYVKDREAIPQQFRDQAYAQLGGLVGLEGGTGSQQALIDRAMQSPLYGALAGGIDDYRTRAIGETEQSILRNAAATGGLRSGNVQRSLATNIGDIERQAQNLQRQALLESYNQQAGQLQGLAGIQSNSGDIAGRMTGIGDTLVSGALAGQQAQQQSLGTLAGIIGSVFSDPALKSDIELIGKRNGFNWYRWVWNEAANALGLHGESEGVMADEVHKVEPEAVSMHNGYLTVDYGKIGV